MNKEEPVTNKFGIQRFYPNKMKPYFSVEYLDGFESHNFQLFSSYGYPGLVDNFNTQMGYLLSTGMYKEIKIVCVWEYFVKEVNYRKTWTEDRLPIVTYDLWRKPVQFIKQQVEDNDLIYELLI